MPSRICHVTNGSQSIAFHLQEKAKKLWQHSSTYEDFQATFLGKFVRETKKIRLRIRLSENSQDSKAVTDFLKKKELLAKHIAMTID